ncbi:transposase family protein [Streptomyces bluensis]|uniref:transposase family protein n=1 Tax=Streptomyces bluensis TaxID=33897 RepID=UPI00357143B9
MACPACTVASDRVHSTYRRCLADMPVGDQPVSIELTVRRLYCEHFRKRADGPRDRAPGRPCTCISPQEAGRLSLDHQRSANRPELRRPAQDPP